jgi:uncharacterized membrane protein
LTPTALALALLLGVGLSASTGLNTFLPLLLLGAAARFGIAGTTLNAKFAWLTSDTALIILIIAAVIEIVADKVPAVDHVLDTIGTFVRPAAGFVAMASVLTGLDPTTAAIVGLIVGSPISLGLHTMKAATRATSTVTTFGCANPILSIVEDVASVGMSLVAIFAPLLVPLLVAVLFFALWKLARRLNPSLPRSRSAP